jgi:hypothetical protein
MRVEEVAIAMVDVCVCVCVELGMYVIYFIFSNEVVSRRSQPQHCQLNPDGRINTGVSDREKEGKFMKGRERYLLSLKEKRTHPFCLYY